ncbi:ankyrin repeat domain-containing protein [Wolbachia endosymbiont (group A) of Cydia strobilella]|uniref:ankyrin repeat domain-containing protein n=1 Tax=Wolbachia endosymbiont (group A) of Cydia strobilella TaxID=3066170 RepID=UPI003133531C
MGNQLEEVSNPINIQADLEENSMVDGIEKRSKEQGFYATQTIPIYQVNQNITYSYLATLDSHLKTDEHCVHESNIHTDLLNFAFHGSLEKVQDLLNKGASVETEDNDGNTPLHFAASKGHFVIVEALLEKGATVEVKNNEGAAYCCSDGSLKRSSISAR